MPESSARSTVERVPLDEPSQKATSTSHASISRWLRAADLLASNKVPVVYGQTFALPARDFESYDVHFKAPELLRQAGVKVAFSFGSISFDAALTRNLPYAAAQAVAFGLP